jgi:hypothetical protein
MWNPDLKKKNTNINWGPYGSGNHGRGGQKEKAKGYKYDPSTS